jgi:hypothetical protein
MGSRHIEYGDGVPYQLAALGIDDVATALPGLLTPNIRSTTRQLRIFFSVWHPLHDYT